MQLHDKAEQFRIFALEYTGKDLGTPTTDIETWFHDGYRFIFTEISQKLREEQLNTIGKEIFCLKPIEFNLEENKFADLVLNGDYKIIKGNDKDFGLSNIMNEIVFHLSIEGNFIYLPDVQVQPSTNLIQEHLRQSLLQSLTDPVHITQKEAKELSQEEIKMIDNWHVSFSVNQDMALLEVRIKHDNGVERRFDTQEELFDYSRSSVWKKDLQLIDGEIPDYLNSKNNFIPITRINPIPLYNFNNMTPEQNTLQCINPNDFLLVYQEAPHIDFVPKHSMGNEKPETEKSFWRRFK